MREQLLQRNACVGKPRLVGPNSADDERLALHIILDRIDAVERDHLTVAKIDDRERPVGRVAAHDRLVKADRQADGLPTEVIFVRPEPWHGVIRFGIRREERRVGTEWVGTVRSGCTPYHYKKK